MIVSFDWFLSYMAILRWRTLFICLIWCIKDGNWYLGFALWIINGGWLFHLVGFELYGCFETQNLICLLNLVHNWVKQQLWFCTFNFCFNNTSLSLYTVNYVSISWILNSKSGSRWRTSFNLIPKGVKLDLRFCTFNVFLYLIAWAGSN